MTLHVEVPQGATSGDVVVSSGGEDTVAGTFTVVNVGAWTPPPPPAPGGGGPLPPPPGPEAPVPLPVDGLVFANNENVVLRGAVFDVNAEPVGYRYYLGNTLVGQGTVTSDEAVEVSLPPLDLGELPGGTHGLVLEVADAAHGAQRASFQVVVVAPTAIITADELGLNVRNSDRLAPLLDITAPAGDTVSDTLQLSIDYAAYTFSRSGRTFVFGDRTIQGNNVGAVGDFEVYAGETLLTTINAPGGSQAGTLDTGPLDVSFLPEGEHVITIVSYQGDANSDIGRTTQFVITVDRSGPVMEIVTPDDGALLERGSHVVTGTAYDASGVTMVIVNGVFAQDTSSDGSFASRDRLRRRERHQVQRSPRRPMKPLNGRAPQTARLQGEGPAPALPAPRRAPRPAGLFRVGTC
jgi:hypothetical protein